MTKYRMSLQAIIDDGGSCARVHCRDCPFKRERCDGRGPRCAVQHSGMLENAYKLLVELELEDMLKEKV